MTHTPTWAFERERPIHTPDLLAMLEAARWSPSFRGLEPWRFLACDRFRHPAAWQKAFDCLAHTEKPWAYNAPLLILTCAETRGRDGNSNPRALFDAGTATAQLCLAAGSRCLVTNSTCDFDAERLRTAFEIPERFVCAALTAVGQHADMGTLGRDLYRREFAARQRQPFESRCFEESWEQPVVPDVLLRAGS